MRWRHTLCRSLGAQPATQTPLPAPPGGTLREPDRTAGPRNPAHQAHAVRSFPCLCVPVVDTSWAVAATAPVPRKVGLFVLGHVAHIDWPVRLALLLALQKLQCFVVRVMSLLRLSSRRCVVPLRCSRREDTALACIIAMVALRCSRREPANGRRCALRAAQMPRHHGWPLPLNVLRMDEDKYTLSDTSMLSMAVCGSR